MLELFIKGFFNFKKQERPGPIDYRPEMREVLEIMVDAASKKDKTKLNEFYAIYMTLAKITFPFGVESDIPLDNKDVFHNCAYSAYVSLNNKAAPAPDVMYSKFLDDAKNRLKTIVETTKEATKIYKSR